MYGVGYTDIHARLSLSDIVYSRLVCALVIIGNLYFCLNGLESVLPYLSLLPKAAGCVLSGHDSKIQSTPNQFTVEEPLLS